ncbi:MAG: autotransporter outer membrane beta-barrel domain-containing protein, partial [Alphaproteobacteria bacterium GM202ARS2]|nr:autotransporter outer membrane beta-barrel domain-containing protein [Alphaproteobacteria bacterium GM202ARS2]
GNRTARIIGNLLNRRGEQLTAATSPSRLLERRRSFASGGLRQGLAVAGSGDNDNGRVRYRSSLRRLGVGDDGADAYQDYDTGPNGLSPKLGWDVWVSGDLSYYRAKGHLTENQGHFGVFKIGADYLINPRFLVGIVAQYDRIKEETNADGYKVEGKGWLAGPYVEYALSENVIVDATALWGTSRNDISPFLTYTDTFKTSRWLAAARITGTWDLMTGQANGVLRFEPSAQLIYFDETSKSYTDSTGLRIGSQGVRLGRLKFGPALSYSYQTPSGVQIRPRIAAQGLWNFSRRQSGTQTGETADVGEVPLERLQLRVEGGLTVELPGQGISVDLSGNYVGLGTPDNRSGGGSVRVRIPLQQP